MGKGNVALEAHVLRHCEPIEPMTRLCLVHDACEANRITVRDTPECDILREAAWAQN